MTWVWGAEHKGQKENTYSDFGENQNKATTRDFQSIYGELTNE
jgi:hypothetical protein